MLLGAENYAMPSGQSSGAKSMGAAPSQTYSLYMLKKLFLMRGLPGSGKTTKAK